MKAAAVSVLVSLPVSKGIFCGKILVYKDTIPICHILLKNFDVSFVPLSIV